MYVTDDCPDAVLIEDLFGKNETLEYNTEYTVSISQDKKVRFFSGWCAVNRKTLDENLKNMKFVLTIDGKSYIREHNTEILLPAKRDQFYKTKRLLWSRRSGKWLAAGSYLPGGYWSNF